MNEIRLKTVEELEAEKAADCLPRGVRAMIVGERVIFVRRIGGRWMPVSSEEQRVLESKHVM